MTAEEARRPMPTEYVILKHDTRDDYDGIFIPQGIQLANGPKQAVRLLKGDDEASNGRYLAVPRRNATMVHHGVVQPAPRISTEELDDDVVTSLLTPEKTPGDPEVPTPRSPGEVIDAATGGDSLRLIDTSPGSAVES